MRDLRHFDTRTAVLAGLAVLATASLTPDAAHAQAQPNSRLLTVVLASEPPFLDSCMSTRQEEGFANKQTVVETLLDKDYKTGEIVPRLATSWQMLNPTTWRFKLREGVKFHDGAAWDAEAAAKTLTRSLTAEIPCDLRGKYFGGLKLSFKPVDTYTLDVTTDKPDPILDIRMSTMTISSPNTPPTQQRIAIGTGPFVLDSWVAGNEIRLKRFDGYWGAKPQAEGVRYVWRAESSVRAAMVKIGEADIGTFISKADADDPKNDVSYLTWETSFWRIDSSRPPLNDKRIRLALNLGFDREGLRTTVMGKDYINATQMVVPGVIGHNHEIDKNIRPYDPAKAKALVAEARAAGVPVDNEITLQGVPTRYPGATELMEAMLTMYKNIGLNVKLVNLERGQSAQIATRPFQDSRGPTVMQTSHDNTLEPIFSVPYKYACEGATSQFCDPAIEKRIGEVAVMTGAERVKGWQDLFRTLYEEYVPEVWGYYMVAYVRVNPRVNYPANFITNNEIHVAEFTFK